MFEIVLRRFAAGSLQGAASCASGEPDGQKTPLLVATASSASGTASDTSEDAGWPDDPDEVPAWRLRAEAMARRYGYVLPGYRTRREFDAQVALCRAVSCDAIKLPADETARRFVAHVAATIATSSTPMIRLVSRIAHFARHRRYRARRISFEPPSSARPVCCATKSCSITRAARAK